MRNSPVVASTERAKLKRGSSLHIAHWLVVGFSFALTITAWQIAKRQHQSRIQNDFDTEADRVIELVLERMEVYEEALRGGVGAIAARDGRIDHASWRSFARAVGIEISHPGIMGIGVILHVDRSDTASYLATETRGRPDFAIHPEHDAPELMPITYIEPEEKNAAAVGLDMAFETNRYTAAKLARSSGEASITGPIVLVQDAAKTPGFLFFLPFYKDGPGAGVSAVTASASTRHNRFAGLVYAPFVVSELMAGTLAQTKRHVFVAINDGGEVLYDEHQPNDRDYDPDPVFRRTRSLELFGRVWTFDITSTKSFRRATESAQPNTILLGGLLIDILLFGLFLSLTRANRRAIDFADLASEEVQAKAERLQESNADLEQFAYVASHDLQEPARMVRSYADLLGARYSDVLDDRAKRYIEHLVSGSSRMQALVEGLLSYSRVERGTPSIADVSSEAIVEEAALELERAIADAGARIVTTELPSVQADPLQLKRVFQNLIGNAIKYRKEGRPPVVRVSGETNENHWKFTVSDNGIGMDPAHAEQAFSLFGRLNARYEFSGSGIGLAVTRKIIERHGGTIHFTSELGKGTTFHFTIPRGARS